MDEKHTTASQAACSNAAAGGHWVCDKATVKHHRGSQRNKDEHHGPGCALPNLGPCVLARSLPGCPPPSAGVEQAELPGRRLHERSHGHHGIQREKESRAAQHAKHPEHCPQWVVAREIGGELGWVLGGLGNGFLSHLKNVTRDPVTPLFDHSLQAHIQWAFFFLEQTQ